MRWPLLCPGVVLLSAVQCGWCCVPELVLVPAVTSMAYGNVWTGSDFQVTVSSSATRKRPTKISLPKMFLPPYSQKKIIKGQNSFGLPKLAAVIYHVPAGTELTSLLQKH